MLIAAGANVNFQDKVFTCFNRVCTVSLLVLRKSQSVVKIIIQVLYCVHCRIRYITNQWETGFSEPSQIFQFIYSTILVFGVSISCRMNKRQLLQLHYMAILNHSLHSSLPARMLISKIRCFVLNNRVLFSLVRFMPPDGRMEQQLLVSKNSWNFDLVDWINASFCSCCMWSHGVSRCTHRCRRRC